ncbi:FAD-binding oxidoreductase [Conexibacter arvalis]|uniref:FAD/FMN-containing dehydrogenase n=1 Tax=Conexibacter arvalis TaxID=912552 RepID=A0A840I991_9ACTN|nr:FAD-dependent oxidoreductase [Conexibacter arvalis]MBB4660704.1 FAD/FMN-containing dehydrogenase [Conexibacter arvalis]
MSHAPHADTAARRAASGGGPDTAAPAVARRAASGGGRRRADRARRADRGSRPPVPSLAAALRELRGAFAGPLHLPGSQGWERERVNWSGTVAAEPALVAEATSAADLRAAVRVARAHGLPLALQGTGHGTVVAADGALLVKTGRMARVSIDPEWEVARVGAGATWGEVIDAAAPYGLAPTSGDTRSVGVAGFTLGGGAGWLARKHGLAADNLLRAEVVTAAGRVVAASATRNSDLFWALRGGGGSFAAVAALELRLHRLPRVHGGVAWFPLERAAATLARYRTWALREQPRELTTAVMLVRAAPPETWIAGPALGIRALYAGDGRDGERAMRGLLEVAGAPVAGGYRTTPYGRAAVGGTAPRCFELLPDLPDDAIAAALALVDGERGAAAAVELRCWDGAVADAGPQAGPAGHRRVPFSLKIDGPASAVEPFAEHVTGGSFLNFLADQSRTREAYTAADWERLVRLKGALDPTGLFGSTHRIAPPAG